MCCTCLCELFTCTACAACKTACKVGHKVCSCLSCGAVGGDDGLYTEPLVEG